MHALRFRSLGVLAVALAVSLSAIAGAKPLAPRSTFALLPLVAGDLGLPYAVFPSPAERTELGRKITGQVVALQGGAAIAPARVAAVLSRDGIDQNSAYRQCASADCARRVGRALHVDTVVYGSVTRYMAMIWGTEVNLLDVASGRVEGPYALGYKGDYMALSSGVDTLAQAVSARMIADAAARNRHRAMALSGR